MGDYPHILFRTQWELSPRVYYRLGQCEAIISAISETPLKPEHHARLLHVSLIKGAQATTAIEGNTLSDEEIAKISEGEPLPPSKEYQKIEVRNILDAMNELLDEVVTHHKESAITPELLKRFHTMVGKNLGQHLDAVPGRFRKDPRVVGTYKCPDHADVPRLVEQLCHWLRTEFRYPSGDQSFPEAVLEAIIAHVYIEWIHPFGDGNGRTGRLVEFFILLRAGNPDVSSHILSNFYNFTRPEYYRQLELAGKSGELTGFIEYAVQGFRDGLIETLKRVQDYQFETAWLRYIYDKFAEEKYRKEVFKRRRSLMLDLPVGESLTVDQIAEVSPRVAKGYANVTRQTIVNDLTVLVEMNLLGKDENRYTPRSEALQMPSRVHRERDPV